MTSASHARPLISEVVIFRLDQHWQRIAYHHDKTTSTKIRGRFVSHYVTRDRRENIYESDEERQGILSLDRAYQCGGYTLKEIASYLNLHYSIVSDIVRKPKSKT